MGATVDALLGTVLGEHVRRRGCHSASRGLGSVSLGIPQHRGNTKRPLGGGSVGLVSAGAERSVPRRDSRGGVAGGPAV